METTCAPNVFFSRRPGSPHYHKRAAAAQPGLAMPARAYKASLNRPYATRSYRAVNMPFQCEYPMVRWLERNGYDVSYWSGVDTDRLGAAISARFRLFLSVGHDEYWSGRQREHVTAARDAGVHLGFFSGNEVYWRIRWEDGATSDGSRTDSHRTVVVYKDTQVSVPELRELRFSTPPGGWGFGEEGSIGRTINHLL